MIVSDAIYKPKSSVRPIMLQGCMSDAKIYPNRITFTLHWSQVTEHWSPIPRGLSQIFTSH